MRPFAGCQRDILSNIIAHRPSLIIDSQVDNYRLTRIPSWTVMGGGGRFTGALRRADGRGRFESKIIIK